MTELSSYPEAPEGSVRLNKFLASCGYESRRAADRLIAAGRVEVNGKAVDTPGLRVLPTDFVKVDGRHATPKEEVVILLNKPRGYVCSREAQGAEGTVYDLLPPKYRYANYVGRLDADSEGLLIFTNNGTLGQSIGHPSGGIEKEYWVTLDQAFDHQVLIQLLKGLRIPEGQAKAKYVSRLSARRACVVLEQGLKRQIRQMFACMGLRVKKLVRVRIGSLWGGDLEPGGAMLLTPEQVQLATTNPKRRKGLVGAKQAFRTRQIPASGQIPAREEELDAFDPADFETEEEALESSTLFSDSEFLEPERERSSRPFGKAPYAGRRGRNASSSFRGRDEENRSHFRNNRRSFRGGSASGSHEGRRPFRRETDKRDRDFRHPHRSRFEDDAPQRNSFRPSFGARHERREYSSGQERPFRPRRPYDGDRPDFRERRPWSERPNQQKRGSFHSQRRSSGDRRPFDMRSPHKQRSFNRKRSGE